MLLWMPVLLAEGGIVYRVGVDGGVCVCESGVCVKAGAMRGDGL